MSIKGLSDEHEEKLEEIRNIKQELATLNSNFNAEAEKNRLIIKQLTEDLNSTQHALEESKTKLVNDTENSRIVIQGYLKKTYEF